jgi:hypothetical protein
MNFKRVIYFIKIKKIIYKKLVIKNKKGRRNILYKKKKIIHYKINSLLKIFIFIKRNKRKEKN